MTSQLTNKFSKAVDVHMANAHSEMDAMLAVEAVRVHFAAVEDPHTPAQLNYVRVLGLRQVTVDQIAQASERLLTDSLDADFMAWSSRFLVDNPSIDNAQ